VSLLLFFLLMILLGFMEGTQISLVKLANMHPEAVRKTHPRAYKTMLFIQKDRNLSRYLIGRQIIVVILVFFLSLLTQFPDIEYFPFSETEIPSWFRVVFIDSGIASVIVIVIVAQLTPQIVSERHPVQAINLPLIRCVVYFAIFFDLLSIAQFSFVLSSALCKIFCNNPPRRKDSLNEEEMKVLEKLK